MRAEAGQWFVFMLQNKVVGCSCSAPICVQRGNFPLACERRTCTCPAAGPCRVADVQLVRGSSSRASSSSSSDGEPSSLLLLSAGNDGALCLWDLGRAAETGSGGRGGGVVPQCLARSTNLHGGGCMRNLLAGCWLDPYAIVMLSPLHSHMRALLPCSPVAAATLLLTPGQVASSR